MAAPGPVTVIEIPGSKSVTARALLAADGMSTLLRPLRSDDTEGFASDLTNFDQKVVQDADQRHVEGRPTGPATVDADTYCRDGATTARFLSTLAAAGAWRAYRFDVSAQMRRRPLALLTEALPTLGVDLRYEERHGRHPLWIIASGIEGGELVLHAGQPSQYLTVLLMLVPLTAGGFRIIVTGLASAPCIEITLAMTRSFGAEVTCGGDDGNVFTLSPGGYRATTYAIAPVVVATHGGLGCVRKAFSEFRKVCVQFAALVGA